MTLPATFADTTGTPAIRTGRLLDEGHGWTTRGLTSPVTDDRVTAIAAVARGGWIALGHRAG